MEDILGIITSEKDVHAQTFVCHLEAKNVMYCW